MAFTKTMLSSLSLIRSQSIELNYQQPQFKYWFVIKFEVTLLKFLKQ